MNNRGFTLIELMIVIAIMGIISNIKYFYTIKKQYDIQEEMVFEQERVIKFYKALKKLLSETKEFKTVKPNSVIADNFSLLLSNDRTKIKLNGRLYTFKSFKIFDFKRDDKNVICNFKNGKNTPFSIYLIAGKNINTTKANNDSVDSNLINSKEQNGESSN